MIKTLTRIIKNRYLAAAGLSAVVLSLGVMFVAAPAATAVSCRVFTPVQDYYEGGRVATIEYTVPSAAVSGCKDINVRNIQNMDPSMPASHPDKYCGKFLVQMMPSNGGEPIYTTQKRLCSKDPAGSANGPVVPVATNVINGTKYRVLYNITSLEHRINYQIVD
jgi:hypothetical protein